MKRLYALPVLFAIAAGFGYVSPGSAAAAEDPCGGCFVVAHWYWENTVMPATDILRWLGLCLEGNDC